MEFFQKLLFTFSNWNFISFSFLLFSFPSFTISLTVYYRISSDIFIIYSEKATSKFDQISKLYLKLLKSRKKFGDFIIFLCPFKKIWTFLSGVLRGSMPPQLKTNKTQYRNFIQTKIGQKKKLNCVIYQRIEIGYNAFRTKFRIGAWKCGSLTSRKTALMKSVHTAKYGNMGCGVFKRGIQNYKGY